MNLKLLQQILMMAKYSFYGLIIQVFLSSFMIPKDSYSQKESIYDIKVDIEVEEESLKNIFEYLEKDTGFEFNYFGSKLNKELKTTYSLSFEKASFGDVLTYLSKKGRLSFKRVDDKISVKTSNRPEYLPTVEESLPVQFRISGKVVSEDQEPLPGLSIIIKGTTTGTTTDLDGNYSLAANEGDILQFSFIGYQTQEIEILNQSTINVTMLADLEQLEEVVIVGYGTRKKQEVTGAVATADLATYRDVPVNNVLETVKGTIPGLNISGINQAGEVGSFSIRGTNSIGASNTPLVVVDGIIYNGSIGDIRSDDIESFTVLKDASAAAIYGARSANGVILIETKKGKGLDGKPQFSVKVATGTTEQFQTLPLYTDGYVQNILDIRESLGQDANIELIDSYMTATEQENYLATPNNALTLPDPNEIGLQDAYFRSADVSVANSTDRGNYFISVGLTDQKGVVLNDDFKQFNARVNQSSNLTDWLNLSVLTSYSLRDFSGSEPNRARIYQLSPYATIFDENGNPARFPQTTTSVINPLWNIASEDSDLRHSLNGAVKARIDIPWVEGLSFTSTLSHNFRWRKQREFFGDFTEVGVEANGSGSREFSSNHYRLFDNIIDYRRTLGEKHEIGVTLLYSREQTTFEEEELEASGFDNTQLGTYRLQDGLIQEVSTGGEESAAIGQMARLNYVYNSKYSLTGTVRRDGYSAFGANNKWGVFASLGFNWNIIDEGFMSNIGVFNNLALSGSYGSVGNRSINRYQTRARVSTDQTIFAGSNDIVLTQAITSFPNDDLGWESTTGLNLGLDFGILENRISGRLDYYRTRTNDLIFNLRVPLASGVASQDVPFPSGPGSTLSNIGEIKNRGIEITLNSHNVKKDDFNWHSTFNFFLNRNEVVSVLGIDGDGDGIEDDLPQNGLFIGRSLGQIFDYREIGLWQQEDEENGTIMDGMRPGDYRTEDIDGDGAITRDQDRQFIGNEDPNFQWSLTNTFQYKNFRLMAYLFSIWGGNDWYISNRNDPYNDFGVDRTDVNHPVYDYWTPTNTGAEFPRPDYRSNATFNDTRRYYDRSFIKLQKVALSYDFTSMVKRIGIEGMTLTLSADNLALYAPHWDGLDPETNQGLALDAETPQGDPTFTRPSLRTYLLSLQFNF